MFAWNRKEALVTMSLDYYLRASAALKENQIRLQSKKVPHAEQVARSDGGMLQRVTTEYYIYVHEEDLPQAKALIAKLDAEAANSGLCAAMENGLQH